jgi:tight adherence protein B
VIGPLLAVIGTILGAGLVLIASGLGWLRLSRRDIALNDRGDEGRGENLSRVPRSPEERRRLALAAVVGLVALLVTRWPMAVPLGALSVLGSRGLGGAKSKATIQRLDAIAAWTEMLRDTLAGAAGLTQSLTATAPIAPKAIRSHVVALAARLNAGVGIVPALVELATEISDPAADTVVACLVMAASERAQRLSDLLGALASATREEVTMRLAVEASRASSRTAVRMITGFSFGLLALMAVFARSYLAPYSAAQGQLVLGAVGCLYGLGLWLMSLMARPTPFPRLPIAAPRLP